MNGLLPFILGLLVAAVATGGIDLTTREAPTPKPPPKPKRRAPRPYRAPTPRPRPTRPKPRATTPAAAPAPSPTAPPWPQVVPAGLPPFPSGWEPDEPVGAGVASRALALMPELWRYGRGTRKTEKTGGRWITYVATAMGEKKGVVAFRLKKAAAPAPPGRAPAPDRARPATVPASYKKPRPARTKASEEAERIRTAKYPTGRAEKGSEHGYGERAAPEPGMGSRTLRLTSPRTTGPDVAALQRRLGIGDDGVFGSGTHASVMAFQRAHKDADGRPLAVDGVVGPKTWGALLGATRA